MENTSLMSSEETNLTTNGDALLNDAETAASEENVSQLPSATGRNDNFAPEERATPTILGQPIDLITISDGLVCPRSWVEEAAAHPQLENVQLFLSRLSPCGRTTPWLISSMTKDLSGALREDSLSHQNGTAIDIAPMYSDTDVLPADPPMSGMAWNLKSLIVISQGQLGDMPMFVEGDHLHFSGEISPTTAGELAVMWSTSSTYESAKQEEADPILPQLRNSYWLWRTSDLALLPPTKETLSTITKLLRKESLRVV
jgi:hypothetical protein